MNETERNLAGRLVGRLFQLAAIPAIIFGLALAEEGRWVFVGLGVFNVCVGEALSRVSWERAPLWFFECIPIGALGLTFGIQYADREPSIVSTLWLSMIFLWSGLALSRASVLRNAGLAFLVAAVPRWSLDGPKQAIALALVTTIVTTTLGLAINWMQQRFADAQLEAAAAEDQAREQRAELQARRERTDRERTAELARQLERSRGLQADVADHAATLSRAAATVSSETASVAGATEQMSTALDDLSRAAAASEQITASVAERARLTAAVMGRLSSSSERIEAASAMIQGIAAQTNLLALNATIEAARAGEAGRGFSVVAQEVKDLARQSGENADGIAAVIADVRAQVGAAVGAVTEISRSTTDLSDRNTALAAAVQEQSTALRSMLQSVSTTAAGAEDIADGVRRLEQVARA